MEDRRGVNKTLQVENNASESVRLHILVRLDNTPGETEEAVFDQNVSVSPGEAREFEILGENQYGITVTGLDQEKRYTTRPICNTAYTRIIVAKNREIQFDVGTCE